MTEKLLNVILNVDDNPASLYAKSRVLRHAGFTVLEAQEGSEALALAASAYPDLVLLSSRHYRAQSGSTSFAASERIAGAAGERTDCAVGTAISVALPGQNDMTRGYLNRLITASWKATLPSPASLGWRMPSVKLPAN